MSVIIFIIILLVLVLVHEFGHFFTAKRFGIRVDEFGFGFPPKLFSRKYGETEYSVNALPLGGFVKIFGENGDEEAKPDISGIASEDPSRSFINKPKWQQAVVLFAGVFMNLLLAWILFSIGFMSGLPTSVGNEVEGYALKDINLVVVSVAPNSPAQKAFLESGDKIISVKALSVGAKGSFDILDKISPETLRSFIVSHPNEEIEIGYMRGKNEGVQIAQVTPSLESGEPIIGIAMDQIGIAKLPFFTAFREGLSLTWLVAKGTVAGLYTLIANSLKGQGSFESVTGPVGIVGIVGDAYQFGFVYLLSFTALISVNLAVINLIPFPALDGGRLFFLLIEKIKGSRINPKFANAANLIGFVVLIFLMLVVTYHDVVKLF